MNIGKKVTVLGIGKSGYESALFLQDKGFRVFLSELKSSPEIESKAEALRLKGIEVETGGHTETRIREADWALISPGISPQTPLYQGLVSAGLPIYSEIEVASWFCASSRIIAVTGSCGKTTVTTLLTRIFQEGGIPAVSCGNIGNPWIGELGKITERHFVILELSSFQLQHCSLFHPHVGILLNIAPNHQDWHSSMEEYIDAKLMIFKNQNQRDYAFVREADRTKFFPEKRFSSQVVYFGKGEEDNPNEQVVRSIGSLFGIGSSEMNRVFSQFQGIEHRMETAGEGDGIRYINDSKSTTPASLEWALKKFPDKSVHLIAGGIAKSEDHGALRPLLKEKAKGLYLIGKAASWLDEAWKGAAPAVQCSSMEEALEKASQSAEAGDSVLLSPACASFDMFANYEDRGKKFKAWVQKHLHQEELQKSL